MSLINLVLFCVVTVLYPLFAHRFFGQSVYAWILYFGNPLCTSPL